MQSSNKGDTGQSLAPGARKKELPQLMTVEVAFKTRSGLGINLSRGCLPEKIKIVPGLVLLVFPDTVFTALARILDVVGSLSLFKAEIRILVLLVFPRISGC